MIVFAAMKCECVYESGFEVLSLHTSKVAAYKACRDWWVARWNEWNHDQSGDGIHDGYSSKKRRLRHDTATHSKRWRVAAMPVLPDNARVQTGTTAPQPDPERDEAARRGASPGTKC